MVPCDLSVNLESRAGGDFYLVILPSNLKYQNGKTVSAGVEQFPSMTRYRYRSVMSIIITYIISEMEEWQRS